MMDIKEAVATAKEYVLELYSGEMIEDVGLEEIDRDSQGHWQVTVGFTRPNATNKLRTGLGALAKRSYKVVTISANGSPTSMKDRELSN